MAERNKTVETLQSRKFWLTAGIIILAVGLYLTGTIQVDEMLDLIKTAGAVYVGALGIEDGFRKILPVLPKLLEAMNGQRQEQD